MQLKSRPNAVRASALFTHPLFTVGLAVSGVMIAALAGVLFAGQGGAPLLMNIERIAPAHEANPVEVEADPVEATRQDEHDVSFEIINEEEIAWLDQEIRFFNGRPIRPVRRLTMIVTAYSPDERSCGKWADGITASGYSVWTNGMKLVAADTSILPFGSLISIPGYDNDNVVPVLDRGGAIKGKRLDVLYPTHERALRWGVQELEVTVWDYADGAPNGFRQNHRRRR